MMGMRKRKPYLTDLTDAQWAELKPHLPPEKPRGTSHRMIGLMSERLAVWQVDVAGA